MCEIAPTTTGCGTAAGPFATGYGYNTAFQLTGFNFGNGVAATFGFSSDRLQMTSLKYVKGTTTLLNLGYSYGAAGSNNGQIMGITDSVDNGRNVTYTYDTVARLSTAVTTGSVNYPKWGLAMTYDRYGNRSAQSISSGCVAPMTCPTNSFTPDVATNRITGDCYDANGNLLAESAPPCPSPTYTYDAENHLVNYTSTGTYTYDGNNLRVKKVTGSTTTIYIFAGSKVIAEYQNGAAVSSPTREYIYSGSTLLAKVEAGATNYYHSDHLSPRLTTDASGNKIGEQGHFPFGESWYSTNTTTKWQFTSYERDSESGNDYAMARYHVNRLGRFSSVDPLAGSTSDPQSLDRYAYAANDPTELSDPSGECPKWGPFANCGSAHVSSEGYGGGGFLVIDLGEAVIQNWFDGFLLSESGFFTWQFFPDPTGGGGGPDGFGGLGSGGRERRDKGLKEQLRDILKDADCASLLGGLDKAKQILDHFLGTVNVDSGASTGSLFNRAKAAIDANRAIAETFTPRGGNFTNGQFTGPNFNTFVGNTFTGYDPSAQLTVQMHELIHAASSPFANSFGLVDLKIPNIPGEPGNRTANIYQIHKKCGIALPPGY